MLRKSLAVMAFVALIAVPGAAQEVEYQWSDDRPDARAPSAITGTRILPTGALELQYRFHKMNFGDVRFGTDVIPFLDVLDVYTGAPFGRTETAHMFTVSYGLLEWLTLEGTAGWLSRNRDFGNEDVFVMNNSSGISDIEAAALIEVYDRDGIKAHLVGGLEIPTGSIEKVGPDLTGTPRLLPYEMQLGTGSFSIVPGASASIQNDKATVGAQVKARFRLFDNGRDYRYGDQFDGAMWAGYLLNEHFAVTTGLRLQKWGTIEGQDSGMDPTLDPGQDPFFSSGTRLDVPLGLNIRMTGGLLSGMDVLFEFVWPTYENFDAPRPEGEWGFNLSVTRDITGLNLPFIGN